MKIRIESTQPIFIEDLKLRVYPGTPTWVEPEVARSSHCLAQLVRLGKLKVSQGQRCTVAKDPPKVPYRAGRMSRPNKGGMQKPFGGGQHPPPKPQTAGMTPQEAEQLATQAAAKAAEMVAQKVVQQVVDSVGASQPQGNDDLEAKIQRAVAAALAAQGGSVSGGSSGTFAGPEEPVFIPTGIVQDDASELKVSSSTSSSGDLDDAAKALRALRKSSKSKK